MTQAVGWEVGKRFKKKEPYVHLWQFTLLYGRNQHNTAKKLSSLIENKFYKMTKIATESTQFWITAKFHRASFLPYNYYSGFAIKLSTHTGAQILGGEKHSTHV